jgi:hypothetical protein
MFWFVNEQCHCCEEVFFCFFKSLSVVGCQKRTEFVLSRDIIYFLLYICCVPRKGFGGFIEPDNLLPLLTYMASGIKHGEDFGVAKTF